MAESVFKPVQPKTSFPQMEQEILRWWQERRIFEKSVDQRLGSPRFTMYEGPPTANGNPGIHHVLARAFKDVIARYRAMKGFYVPRKAGWDTHGLPVELEVERQLGFTRKSQIEEYGIDKFNKLCRESVFRYLKEWETLTDRIAYWTDLAHPYVTLDNTYIESCWWALKQLWDKGLVYQGYRVTPHCPRCGTSLSSHEVALGYKDETSDPSVYVKFRLDPASVPAGSNIHALLTDASSPAFILAWTTTPWTLPGNTAVAVSPTIEYVVVEIESGDPGSGVKERLVLAEALLGSAIKGEHAVLVKVPGSVLVGLRYLPLYSPAEACLDVVRFDKSGAGSVPMVRHQFAPGEKVSYPVIGEPFVSTEEGTGVVHIAPAFGDADFQAGQEHGLFFLQPVDPRGIISDPAGKWPFSGKFVKDADPIVLKDLKSRGLVYRSERIKHTYPFCWRCDSPLLYYAKKSWYIRTTAAKDRLVSGNESINWYPDHIKYGRFGDWLKNNVDWAFSRESFWGTPLSVWHCQMCGQQDCVGSVADLKGKPGLAGLEEPLDLHRPHIDKITFSCKCGGTMQRVQDVIDCWFDSGAMPVAQWHYPFENQDIFKASLPADYICEGVDQTRGWFYSLHALSTLLFDKPCFKNVICLGHILDAKGEKMSKTRGNVVKPFDMLDKYSADALRWYLFTSSPAGNVRRFTETGLAEGLRKYLLTLWNTYSFFVTYANIDKFNPTSQKAPEITAELDRWILSALNQLILDVDKGLQEYDPTGAGRKIEAFVDDLSNWYVRRSRRRFWKSENDADKLSAHHTLHRCLVTVAKLSAPFTPFMSEEIYRNLVVSVDGKAPESVHLADFPVADPSVIDIELTSMTSLAIKLSSLGRAARAKAALKVRQPLEHVLVKVNSDYERDLISKIADQVIEELNVKKLEISDNLERPGYAVAVDGGHGASVPREVPADLQLEGMAREIVHKLQTMRRTAGFDIADHIVTCYEGDAYIDEVMAAFAGYIRQETLSDQLICGAPGEGAYTESDKLIKPPLTLGVKRR
ncbi:MAG: isoleucine--tRNA ligase [Dehalococcoidia bacterium]|nr:isoleucine--tRNA ligase [Dehalococcoidia bacterium]